MPYSTTVKVMGYPTKIKIIFWRHNDCFSTTRLYLTSWSLLYLNYTLWLLIPSGTLVYRTGSYCLWEAYIPSLLCMQGYVKARVHIFMFNVQYNLQWLLISSGTLVYRTESQRKIVYWKPIFLAYYE